MVYCKECGTENPDNAEFCQECGNELVPENEDNVMGTKSTGLIIFGYIFAVLGLISGSILSLVGLVIGFTLLRRGGPDRGHGIIITVISAFVILIWIAIAILYVYYAYLT
ncbi:zinc ribbon domain-containing protein [Methanobacterium sp. CWC-01]|uniref:zinc ribbon domain-containing protein n=1 Tax=Methanobacterium aridiramus TaxID=2584467 RepID=UPI00257773F6|nr:zinc ribbon domain-containing protein [Methanobacterium sp. CWC-01]WJI10468.1 zinc ribbon domain-containing protein [Methanobacterium sp. CWC-01]